MSVAHEVITDPYLHEPKGIAAAAIDKVYVSDGAGSGTWQKLTTSQVDLTSLLNANQSVLTFLFPDISTASDQYIVFPFACTVNKIYGVLQAAIASVDTVFTFANHAGGSMGTMTVAFTSSAAGDVDSLTPVSNNTFAAGEHIKITSDGGSTNTVPETFTFLVTQTA